jgi:putative hydrolase of the HAD superfamily
MKYAVSFDFWNTLYADGDEPLRKLRRQQIFCEHVDQAAAIDPEKLEDAFEASSRFFFEEWATRHRTPRTRERLILIASELQLVLNEKTLDTIATEYGDLIFEIPPRHIPELHDVLPHLASQYPLGIISDTGYISGQYIRQFLEEKQILGYFDSQIFSDEQQYSKPHPSVFNRTAGNLGIKPPGLIHIGDLERTDIAGVQSAGGVALRYTGANQRDADTSAAAAVFDDYLDLPVLLEQLTNNR